MIDVNFRNDFPSKMQNIFKVYWHAMHPVIVDRGTLYRYAWSDEEWDALMLLKATHKRAINMRYNFTYKTNLKHDIELPYTELPYTRPKLATLKLNVATGMPDVTVLASDLPTHLRAQLDDWIIEAYRYKHLSSVLYAAVLSLLHHNLSGDRHTPICNTPGTLYAVWPELLPFFPEYIKEEIRSRKVKPILPRRINKKWVEAFHSSIDMHAINEALIVTALLPQNIDEDYPIIQ